MVVCKQCGTVYEEIFNTCPKCGAVHQLPDDNVYDVPRRKMPGTPERSSNVCDDIEIKLSGTEKKKPKTPTVVALVIAFALLLAVAITLIVVFSGKNGESSDEKTSPKPEIQISQDESVPAGEQSGEASADVSQDESTPSDEQSDDVSADEMP